MLGLLLTFVLPGLPVAVGWGIFWILLIHGRKVPQWWNVVSWVSFVILTAVNLSVDWRSAEIIWHIIGISVATLFLLQPFLGMVLSVKPATVSRKRRFELTVLATVNFGVAICYLAMVFRFLQVIMFTVQRFFHG